MGKITVSLFAKELIRVAELSIKGVLWGLLSVWDTCITDPCSILMFTTWLTSNFIKIFSLFFVIRLRATGLVVTQRFPRTSSALASVWHPLGTASEIAEDQSLYLSWMSRSVLAAFLALCLISILEKIQLCSWSNYPGIISESCHEVLQLHIE